MSSRSRTTRQTEAGDPQIGWRARRCRPAASWCGSSATRRPVCARGRHHGRAPPRRRQRTGICSGPAPSTDDQDRRSRQPCLALPRAEVTMLNRCSAGITTQHDREPVFVHKAEVGCGRTTCVPSCAMWSRIRRWLVPAHTHCVARWALWLLTRRVWTLPATSWGTATLRSPHATTSQTSAAWSTSVTRWTRSSPDSSLGPAVVGRRSLAVDPNGPTRGPVSPLIGSDALPDRAYVKALHSTHYDAVPCASDRSAARLGLLAGTKARPAELALRSPEQTARQSRGVSMLPSTTLDHVRAPCVTEKPPRIHDHSDLGSSRGRWNPPNCPDMY